MVNRGQKYNIALELQDVFKHVWLSEQGALVSHENATEIEATGDTHNY